MKTLVVIDMQKDFIEGALGFPSAKTIIPECNRLINCAVEHNDAIIFTQDTHYPWYYDTQEGKRLPIIHGLRGTSGWHLHPDLIVPQGDNVRIVEKWGFGYDQWERHYDLLSDEEIVICGLVTSICVVTNALLLKTYCPESRIVVVGDATADSKPESYAAARAILTANQVRWEEHYDYI